MKKIKCSRKLYLDRRAVSLSQKRFKANRLRLKIKLSQFKRKLRTAEKTEININAPKIFQLTRAKTDRFSEEARESLLYFIRRINEILSSNKRVNISFKHTTALTPAGTLLFISEIERLIDKYPNKIVMDYPQDDVVEQLFQHLGLFKKVGLVHRREITAGNVAPWNYAYGESVDTTQFIKLFEKYSGCLSEDVSDGLFESMSEAVTNSVQHSCGHHAPCSCKKNWWMFARQDENALEVAIYDAGVGIPKSLKIKPELKEWIMRPINSVTSNSDTALIKIAVQSHRTSTRLPHRGKGLRDMLLFVKGGNVGGFSILSGHGSIAYSAITKKQSSTEFKSYLKGTLIQWKLPLNS